MTLPYTDQYVSLRVWESYTKDLRQSNNAISEFQFSFRKSQSAADAVNYVSTTVKASRKIYVTLIALDVKRALNSANWTSLVNALNRAYISSHLVNITSKYLENKRITVTKTLSAGFQQGSVLGPTLWNVLYRDVLTLNLGVNCWFIVFADELMVLVEEYSLCWWWIAVTEHWKIFEKWMYNDLEFALNRTSSVIIEGIRSGRHIVFRSGNDVIQPAKDPEYLGITLNHNITTTSHIVNLTEKVLKKIVVLQKIMPNVKCLNYFMRILLSLTLRCYTGLLDGTVFCPRTRTKTLFISIIRSGILRVISGYWTVSTVTVHNHFNSLLSQEIHMEYETRWENEPMRLGRTYCVVGRNNGRKVVQVHELNHWSPI